MKTFRIIPFGIVTNKRLRHNVPRTLVAHSRFKPQRVIKVTECNRTREDSIAIVRFVQLPSICLAVSAMHRLKPQTAKCFEPSRHVSHLLEVGT
jgi:hypothetical protein